MSAEFIVWHCSASGWGTAETIGRWHRDGNGWSAIGYHGVVLNGYNTSEDEKRESRIDWLDGQFETGRTWDSDGMLERQERGAHAYGINSESIGLCLIGQDGVFTRAQLDTAIDVTQRWMEQFAVPLTHVIGHYEIGIYRPEFQTEKTCPDINMDFVRDVLRARQDLSRHLEHL